MKKIHSWDLYQAPCGVTTESGPGLEGDPSQCNRAAFQPKVTQRYPLVNELHRQHIMPIRCLILTNDNMMFHRVFLATFLFFRACCTYIFSDRSDCRLIGWSIPCQNQLQNESHPPVHEGFLKWGYPNHQPSSHNIIHGNNMLWESPILRNYHKAP